MNGFTSKVWPATTGPGLFSIVTVRPDKTNVGRRNHVGCPDAERETVFLNMPRPWEIQTSGRIGLR